MHDVILIEFTSYTHGNAKQLSFDLVQARMTNTNGITIKWKLDVELKIWKIVWRLYALKTMLSGNIVYFLYANQIGADKLIFFTVNEN